MRSLLFALVLSYIGSTLTQAQPPARFDGHVYSLPKPFKGIAMGKDYNVWTRIEHDCSDVENTQAFSGHLLHSQASLLTMLKGGVRMSNQLLTAFEVPFLRSKFLESKTNMVNLRCMLGLPFNDKPMVRDDYFRLIREELLLLRSIAKEPHREAGRVYRMRIIKDLTDLQEVEEKATLLGLLISLEGGHLLGSYDYIKANMYSEEEYKNQLMANIERLKGVQPLIENMDNYLDFPIFSINFANSFDDGICGKIQVLSKEEQLILAEQTTINEGFTEVGKAVVRKLLDIENNRRILIDVVDMPVAGRKWLYEEMQTRRYHGDTIPILASGVAVCPLNWKNSDYRAPDTGNKSKDNYWNISSASLVREDLRNIQASQGLISLSLQVSRLAGGQMGTLIEATAEGSAERREAFIKILMANICQVIKTLQAREAWDLIAIGSGFDGSSTNRLSSYNTAESFDELEADLVQFLENPSDLFELFSAEEVRALMYDYNAKDLVRKIFYDNARMLLTRHLQKRNLRVDELAEED